MAQFRPYVPNAVDFHPEEITDSDTIRSGGASFVGAVTMGTNKITGLGDPTAAQDAATKFYVDSVAAGLTPKESCRARTTADIDLANDAANGDVVDGVTLATGDRLAAFDQSTSTQDGIYVVQATGAAVRSADFASGSAQAGAFFFIEEGTVHEDNGYVVTNDAGSDVVGTDDLILVIFSNVTITGGDGIDVTGSVVSVDIATTSGLEFNAGELRIDIVSTDELSIDASGLNVEGVPTLFNIGASAVGAAVTAANLDTLTDGSNADALHLHAGVGNPQETTDGTGVTIGDALFYSGNGIVSEIDAASANSKKYIGLADATVGATSAVGLSVEGRLVTVTPAGTTPAAGDLVYIANGGGLTVDLPSSSGDFIVVVGKMRSGTEVRIGPGQYMGKVA